ncbi:NAD(FAD)-utilizing dehydrogenases [Lentimonas sp. CC19]|nr:NAD(FAD)-utilizing dehydrogenases [Lentimonas sp. CC19]CAA6690654.1 NAD(FAD)-utilizing dehydrogenases [Lentimonas sp. CC10]CAA7068908.1 NAD(FAD)-utilizing dehydrogenases [Lentimonas sp. CC11]
MFVHFHRKLACLPERSAISTQSMSNQTQRNIAIIGGGPAGLRAAEVAANAGAFVTVLDAKPSVGRKFLVAGKSGLNITNSAAFETFVAQYSGKDLPVPTWRKIIGDFDNTAMTEWAQSLGINTFSTAGGKVFPETKKAAPILRRWVQRLREMGVDFQMNHRWLDLRKKDESIELEIECPEGVFDQDFDAVILAMGGGSWPKTGSNGQWVSILEKHGIAVEKLQSANCGWEANWTEATRTAAEGCPLHNIHVRVGEELHVGELMITRYGFEGTPIYALGRTLREMDAPEIVIDFKPTFTVERLVQKMESARRNFFHEAQLRWKLSKGACAIIQQLHGEFDSAQALAEVVKSCRIPLSGARPLDEVISTSGGVAWNELDETLMLKKLPNVYCAGEMIDWEAPTGGFLMQGCFATGSTAGYAASLKSV